MSVRDYQDAPLWERFKYRFSRNPFAIFFTASIFLRNRLVPKKASLKDQLSIYLTNLVFISIIIVFSQFLGLKSYLLIQAPILFFASAIGSWLFYVQHQFTGTRWEQEDQWNHLVAVFEDTSFYDLPKVLHWLTGNIGYHHVHHLNPRIPNYNLAKCLNSIAELQSAPILSLRSSLKTLNNHLWDENKGKFVKFNIISMQKGVVCIEGQSSKFSV
jgi:omega-6 fatty acid desaturase (delta-12 desaturase)